LLVLLGFFQRRFILRLVLLGLVNGSFTLLLPFRWKPAKRGFPTQAKRDTSGLKVFPVGFGHP
jgi:hypothetical protein